MKQATSALRRLLGFESKRRAYKLNRSNARTQAKCHRHNARIRTCRSKQKKRNKIKRHLENKKGIYIGRSSRHWKYLLSTMFRKSKVKKTLSILNQSADNKNRDHYFDYLQYMECRTNRICFFSFFFLFFWGGGPFFVPFNTELTANYLFLKMKSCTVDYF